MLDVIIPAYNDIEGLRRTLNSVVYPEFEWITVTVVDDHSQEDYSEIKKEYPTVQFYRMASNHGPGVARNFARTQTHQPYILFVDCGDIIFSKWSFLEIQDIIVNNPNYCIYQWGWIDDEVQLVRWDTHHSTPGKIYSRKFLEDYHLWQCDGKGSYAGEDLSMNTACVAILDELKEKNDKEYVYISKTPIYSTVTNPNSLTHKNNKEFMYKQTPGYIENITHCLMLCRKNNIKMDKQLEILNNLTGGLYHQFLLGLNMNPEFEKTCWPAMHKFYQDCYSLYENEADNDEKITLASGLYMKGWLHVNKTNRPVNMRRFLNEIKHNENLPNYYLTIC